MIFEKFFGKNNKDDINNNDEHAILIFIKLSDAEFGSKIEREEIFALADRMENAVIKAGVGEYDGNDFGEGIGTLYFYGPDANSLFLIIEKILRTSKLASGAKILKRFGSAADNNVKNEIVEY